MPGPGFESERAGATATQERVADFETDEPSDEAADAAKADFELEPDDPLFAQQFGFEAGPDADATDSEAHEYTFIDGDLWSIKRDEQTGQTVRVSNREQFSGEMLEHYEAAMSELAGGAPYEHEVRWKDGDTEEALAYTAITYELLDNGRVRVASELKYKPREPEADYTYDYDAGDSPDRDTTDETQALDILDTPFSLDAVPETPLYVSSTPPPPVAANTPEPVSKAHLPAEAPIAATQAPETKTTPVSTEESPASTPETPLAQTANSFQPIEALEPSTSADTEAPFAFEPAFQTPLVAPAAPKDGWQYDLFKPVPSTQDAEPKTTPWVQPDRSIVSPWQFELSGELSTPPKTENSARHQAETEQVTSEPGEFVVKVEKVEPNASENAAAPIAEASVQVTQPALRNEPTIPQPSAPEPSGGGGMGLEHPSPAPDTFITESPILPPPEISMPTAIATLPKSAEVSRFVPMASTPDAISAVIPAEITSTTFEVEPAEVANISETNLYTPAMAEQTQVEPAPETTQAITIEDHSAELTPTLTPAPPETAIHQAPEPQTTDATQHSESTPAIEDRASQSDAPEIHVPDCQSRPATINATRSAKPALQAITESTHQSANEPNIAPPLYEPAATIQIKTHNAEATTPATPVQHTFYVRRQSLAQSRSAEPHPAEPHSIAAASAKQSTESPALKHHQAAQIRRASFETPTTFSPPASDDISIELTAESNERRRPSRRTRRSTTTTV